MTTRMNHLPGIEWSVMSRQVCRSHYAEGTGLHVGNIEMVSNTGTFVDSPFDPRVNGSLRLCGFFQCLAFVVLPAVLG